MNEIFGGFPLSHLVDAVIALTIAEGVALVVYYRITGRGVAPLDSVSNLLAGLFLMMALRSALVNAGWLWIVFCLSASGLAHATDMRQRWTRLRRCQ